MSNKLIVILALLGGAATAFGENDYVDILIKNKNVIINNLLKCPDSTKSTNRCYFFERDSLIRLLRLQLVDSLEKERIALIYFRNIDAIIRANSNGSCWVTDSLNFNFIIDALRSGTEHIAYNASNILLQQSDINRLRNNRQKIKLALSNAPHVSKDIKIKLLALATDSTDMNTVKDTSGLEMEIKQYLFDTITENKWISILATDKDYRNKNAAVYDLLLKGRRRCLEALILHFNVPSFDWYALAKGAPPCTSGTLRMPIINGIARYFPNEPLLNDSLYYLKHDRKKKYDKKYVSHYFNRFLQWAKNEFGVEPKDPEPPPTVDQDCRIY